jgi:hypothetical protein
MLLSYALVLVHSANKQCKTYQSSDVISNNSVCHVNSVSVFSANFASVVPVRSQGTSEIIQVSKRIR